MTRTISATVLGMQPDELRHTAAEHIRTAVARGRATCATIVADNVEYLHGHGEPDRLRALAWELVGPEFVAHFEAQATWPERTDSDRLTDAFRILDASGIVAREDFACCQACGTAEIGHEAIDAAPPRGYVFYHGQDAERAAAGGSLWLSYGRFDQERSAETGAEVVSALRAEGLDVDWDGSPDRRIHVRLTWARRRHGRLAAFLADGPTEPDVAVEVTRGRMRLDPRVSTAELTQLILPWLPGGVSIRVQQEFDVHREHHRLVRDDGLAVGRFDGLRLSRGEGDTEVPDEPGLLEVMFESQPTGPVEDADRPMVLPEVLGVLRRLPTRTDSWLSVRSGTGGIVQMRWQLGRLWLETPHPQDATSTGKHASLDEAERTLTILATEDRVAVTELAGVTTQPWS
jgi:hypothetical protein